ncbi:hypothetical protein IWQ61_001884 [Dispira simplex]|nr:hypothetical protein IWQ61_001884 [Dispira simplex]
MSTTSPKVYYDTIEVSECEIPFNPFCQPCSCRSPQQVIYNESISSRPVTRTSKRRRRHSPSPSTTVFSPTVLRRVDPQVARQLNFHDFTPEAPPYGDSLEVPTSSLPINPPVIPLGTNRVYDLAQQLAHKVETLERSLAHLRNLDQEIRSVSFGQDMISTPPHQPSTGPFNAGEARSDIINGETDLADPDPDLFGMFYRDSHEVDRGDPAVWRYYRHDERFMTAANEFTDEMLKRMKDPQRETIEQLVTHIAESHTKSPRHANLIRYSLTRYICNKANRVRSKFYSGIRAALSQHLNIPEHAVPLNLQKGKRDQWYDLPEVVNVRESLLTYRTTPDNRLPLVWETRIIPQCFTETERNLENLALMLARAELFLSDLPKFRGYVRNTAKLYLEKLRACGNEVPFGDHTIAKEQRIEEEGNGIL